MWDDFLSPYYGRDAVTVLPVILHPKSRGSIRLRSDNPFDHPSIDPKYFSHPDDLRGVNLIKKIFNVYFLKKAKQYRNKFILFVKRPSFWEQLALKMVGDIST